MDPTSQPTSPDYQGGQSSHRQRTRRAIGTLALAERISRIETTDPAHQMLLDKIAFRLRRCAEDQNGWKCENFACPRCSARSAKRRRKKAEGMLARTPPEYWIGHLTLTLGSDDLGRGRHILLATFARLRRRRWWTNSIHAGRGQLEIAPSVGTNREWNVHLHVVLWIIRSVSNSRLRSTWQTLLNEEQLAGSATLTTIRKRFVPFSGNGA